ncbi:MAG: helix-turn-helix domain-containing protein, partial [Acidimicrobiia bacterium]
MRESRLRELREAAGLTQSELAARAGVSRQLVGAVEAGRHLPRVDAALSLAAALGVDAELLFSRRAAPIDVLSGDSPPEGSLVRIGRVGDRTLTSPARVGMDGWDVADGVVEGGEVAPFGRIGPGVVVVGCEPGLEAMERLLREGGMGAVAVTGSSASAIEALSGGRAHAAVVHGPEGWLPGLPDGVEVARFRLVRWRVGLAGPAGVAVRWWENALRGRVPVVQREPGAGVQGTFEEAVGAAE